MSYQWYWLSRAEDTARFGHDTHRPIYTDYSIVRETETNADTAGTCLSCTEQIGTDHSTAYLTNKAREGVPTVG